MIQIQIIIKFNEDFGKEIRVDVNFIDKMGYNEKISSSDEIKIKYPVKTVTNYRR